MQIIRVILEGSCQVWDGGLSKLNRKNLQRVQKQCLRIILPNLKYKEALKQLDLEDLQTRRTKLTEKFAKHNQKYGKLAKFFETNKKIHAMKTRNPRKYNVLGNTKRFMNSPILHMKRLINKIMQKQKHEGQKTKSVLYL